MTVAQYKHLTEYLTLIEQKLPGSTPVGAWSAGILGAWACDHNFLPTADDIDRMLNCQSIEQARNILEVLDAMLRDGRLRQ